MLRQEQRVLGLLGGQGADVTAGPQGVDQHVVCQHVELEHRLALHVVLASITENIDQPGAVDLAGDARRRRGQDAEQAGQVPFLGPPPSVIPAKAGIHQVLSQRHALAIHDDSLHQIHAVSVVFGSAKSSMKPAWLPTDGTPRTAPRLAFVGQNAHNAEPVRTHPTRRQNKP